MRVDAIRQYTTNKPTYVINLSDVIAGEYRARLFLYYNGPQSYYGTTGYGLTTDVAGTTYDDWKSEFRKPRIDAHKFNTELVVPISVGRNVVNFSDNFSDDSESAIRDAKNPMNLLLECKESEVDIRRIIVKTNEVFLELVNSSLNDGDSVTISNSELASKHLLGPNSLRICGTFTIHKVSGNVYRYDVKHYTDADIDVEITPEGYTLSKWRVCYFDCGNIHYTRLSDESAEFNFGEFNLQATPVMMVGDSMSIGTVLCRVLEVNGSKVKVNAFLGDSTVVAKTMYCARIPASSVPANWPVVSSSGTRSGADTLLSNAPVYDPNENTILLTPKIDTYFEAGDIQTDHSNSKQLICRGGSRESIVCLQFASNIISAEETASAELTLFVEDMTYSEATIMLYQMDSAGWSPSMTYDEIKEHFTGIPIGNATLYNPALEHDNNDHTYSESGGATNYGRSVTIQIASSIISDWLSGNASYTPSIAIKVIGEGEPSVTFSSANCDDREHYPNIVISGGSSGVTPEPFEINLSATMAEPGQIIRITPTDVSVNNFGNSIFSNVVQIGSPNATIVSGNSTYLDVVVPDGLDGSCTVMVYRKTTTGELIPLTYDNASVYVSGGEFNKSIPLAKKLKPGVIDVDRVGRTAMYNRDMGFLNMKEVTDETSLIQNVYSILLTNPGERLFNQDFGTGIEQRLFKIGSQEEGMALLQECIQQVGIYEPRVYIDGDQSTCEFDNSENLYYLLLCVVLPSARSEMIRLPFKNRGRMV